jgi:hypothetical protein
MGMGPASQAVLTLIVVTDTPVERRDFTLIHSTHERQRPRARGRNVGLVVDIAGSRGPMAEDERPSRHMPSTVAKERVDGSLAS